MNFVAVNPDQRLAGSPGYWSDLNPIYKDVLQSPNSELLTASYQGTGKNFVLQSQGALKFQGTHFSKPQPQTFSQVKLITSVAQRDVEAKFTNIGLIRLWTNFGTFVPLNLRNITAKVKTDTTFSRVSYAAGFDWNYKDFDLSTRVHVKGDSEPFLNQKLAWSRKNIQVHAVCKLSLATLLFSKVNILTSYSHQNYACWLKQNISLKSKSVLAALYKAKRSESVFKAAFSKDHRNHLNIKCTLGTVFLLDNKTTLRARINTNGDLATSASYIVNNNLKVSVGSKVNVTEPSSFTTTTVIPVPIGISLDFIYN